MRAKEFIPASKPRNFVAKNAMKTTSGAGAHRDKKKEQKQGYEKHKGQGIAEASFTAAASMHAATRKQDPQPQDPKHDFRVGDDVVTKKGSKPGKVVFVDGEKIHVKGTNPYYPDHITHHTASELKKGVAEGDDVASAEVLLKRYELLTQSIRNAIDQRDYNEKSKHIEQVRDALEKHYGIDPDKVNEEATSGEPQEYTVRVVDEENSGYTVKVTATSEQGALHKAIVRVRNSGARPEHARIIRQGVSEADETSWTANSARFRKEEDLSWTVEVTLEPRADINQGRGRQVKTQIVTAQSRDAAKKKLADYYRKNGWAVTGIKFAGDLDEARRVKGGDYQLKLVDRQEDDTTDLDDVVMDYYFDVYQNGQKIGHAQGDSYYGELVVKTDFNREFKLDTYHDKDHPLIQQFEKIQQQGVAEGESALEKFRKAAAEREKKHADIEAKRQAAAKQGKTDVKGAIDRLEKHLKKEDTDIPFNQCPQCGGAIVHESQINEKQDACYHKVRSRYKVWPSAYASGALVQCRKKGAKNWGNKSKK